VPWVGYGLGWERGSFSAHGSALDGDTEWVWSGMEFANFQLGADFMLPRRAIIAPFVSFSLGEYDNQTTTTRVGSVTRTTDQDLVKQSLHEWIFIGVRIAIMP